MIILSTHLLSTQVQPPRVVINGAAETPIPAEEVTSEGQLSTSETKTSDLSPLSQLDVISLQSSTGTSSSKQHKTKVHFARSITMESHRSEKRVSIGSVDSCATISSASSHGSDAGSDFEADVGGSSNCPTLNLPPEEEQTSSDIPADGFELDYSSSSAMDSLSLNDTIGEMPGIRRSTPRQHQVTQDFSFHTSLVHEILWLEVHALIYAMPRLHAVLWGIPGQWVSASIGGERKIIEKLVLKFQTDHLVCLSLDMALIVIPTLTLFSCNFSHTRAAFWSDLSIDQHHKMKLFTGRRETGWEEELLEQ